MPFPVPADEPLYTLAEAAHLLRVRRQTLSYWLEGLRRGSRVYLPVIRREPTGSTEVTWPEFVEAGWLAEYRQAKVSLPDLRGFVERARDKWQTEHPLAHYQPFHSGRDLLDVQADLPDEYSLIRERDGQLMLTAVAEAFIAKVEFDADDVVHRYWPRGRDHLVVIDPLVNYGAPTVGGIKTESLFEAFRRGDDPATIARDWDVDYAAVMAAVQWENMMLPTKAA